VRLLTKCFPVRNYAERAGGGLRPFGVRLLAKLDRFGNDHTGSFSPAGNDRSNVRVFKRQRPPLSYPVLFRTARDPNNLYNRHVTRASPVIHFRSIPRLYRLRRVAYEQYNTG